MRSAVEPKCKRESAPIYFRLGSFGDTSTSTIVLDNHGKMFALSFDVAAMCLIDARLDVPSSVDGRLRVRTIKANPIVRNMVSHETTWICIKCEVSTHR